jgi:hypothetical protein
MMSAQPPSLPVIESCDNCGACCLVVTRPPFYHVFEDIGEEAWDRLQRQRTTRPAEPMATRSSVLRVSGSMPEAGNAGITSIARWRATCSKLEKKIAATRDAARVSSESRRGKAPACTRSQKTRCPC